MTKIIVRRLLILFVLGLAGVSSAESQNGSLSYPVTATCQFDLRENLADYDVTTTYTNVRDPLMSHPDIVGFITLTGAPLYELSNAFFESVKECYPLSTTTVGAENIDYLPSLIKRLRSEGASSISITIDNEQINVSFKDGKNVDT